MHDSKTIFPLFWGLLCALSFAFVFIEADAFDISRYQGINGPAISIDAQSFKKSALYNRLLQQEEHDLQTQAKRVHIPPGGNGIAFAFSGAGARISQHLALMEVLVNGLNPSGQKIRPSALAGASSGGLSVVALNAIIQTQEQNITPGFTWDDYKKLMFSLTSSDIYDDSVTGLAKILVRNIPDGYVLDNTPLEKLLAKFLKQMNYKTLGDLYIPTTISIVNQSSGLAQRLWSTDPAHSQLDLLQVMMASASLPIAFTPRKIDGLGNTLWIDGGTGIDTIPVVPLIREPNIDKVYILCYNDALTSGGGTLPKYLDYLKLLKNALATIEDMRVDLFNGAIEVAMKSNTSSFAYIPVLNTTFSVLDFSNERHQYQVTYDWAIQNNPIPLN